MRDHWIFRRLASNSVVHRLSLHSDWRHLTNLQNGLKRQDGRRLSKVWVRSISAFLFHSFIAVLDHAHSDPKLWISRLRHYRAYIWWRIHQSSFNRAGIAPPFKFEWIQQSQINLDLWSSEFRENHSDFQCIQKPQSPLHLLGFPWAADGS